MNSYNIYNEIINIIDKFYYKKNESNTFYSFLQEQNQNNNIKNEKINKIENKSEKNDAFIFYLKKFYKKLILKTHPDKNTENTEYFIHVQYFYEKKILIGLIYYFIKLKLPKPEINNELIQIYLNEIYYINQFIVNK
jgi:hypothetical protein